MPTGCWKVRYVRMIDMSLESDKFREKSALIDLESAWPVGSNIYSSASGRWLPLQEGKMASLYNHRYASVQQPTNSTSGQGISIHSTIEQLRDPNYIPTPRYWINEKYAEIDFDYAIGINDVCNTNNQRSLLSTIVPRGAYGNKLPLLVADGIEAKNLVLLQGNLGSIICDYVARQKIQSRNINKYILEQLPIVPPENYGKMFGPKSAAEIVRAAVLELTYTANDMVPFARDMGYVGADGVVLPPFIWNEERRLNLRAKLDALYFIFYGVFDPADPAQGRDDIRYIYSTFPIVEREEIAAWGSYRSRELCLAWINALIAGQPDADVRG